MWQVENSKFALKSNSKDKRITGLNLIFITYPEKSKIIRDVSNEYRNY